MTNKNIGAQGKSKKAAKVGEVKKLRKLFTSASACFLSWLGDLSQLFSTDMV
ncbi:hypothetical protein IMCC1989_187 [gamma proteobacterium IMCC1989]|nr:hypothetical protein IMCC1989_187 [gamma proteobacterium IMCC1989]